MARRIITMRQELVAALVERGEELHKWKHISDQIGMFAFTGLTPDQVQKMLDEHGIYLTKDGRMSMAGMKAADVPIVGPLAPRSTLSSCLSLLAPPMHKLSAHSVCARTRRVA